MVSLGNNVFVNDSKFDLNINNISGGHSAVNITSGNNNSFDINSKYGSASGYKSKNIRSK